MITIAACGRARITADVTFTPGGPVPFQTFELGIGAKDGFVMFLDGSNISSVRATVDNCIEWDDQIRDKWGNSIASPDRQIGTMFIDCHGEIAARTENNAVWEREW